MMFIHKVPLLCLVLSSTTLVYTLPLASSDPVVNLGYTQYQGTPLIDGVTQWLGMRYAAPPVGDLRFRAPRDPIPNPTLQIANKARLLRTSQLPTTIN